MKNQKKGATVASTLNSTGSTVRAPAQKNTSKNAQSSSNHETNVSEFVVTKQSSLCILIPNHDDDNDGGSGDDHQLVSLFDHIQHMRQENDKSFNRWPPHMNLMYPFVHKKSFFKAKQLIEEAIERKQVQSFQVELPAHQVYCREFSKFVLASPIDEKQLGILQEIYAMLKEIFPQCTATGALEESEGKKGLVEEKFHPHLTLGQLSNSNLANVKKTKNSKETTPNEFEKMKNEWKGGKFKVCELVFMWRESVEEPFHVTERIPLII